MVTWMPVNSREFRSAKGTRNRAKAAAPCAPRRVVSPAASTQAALDPQITPDIAASLSAFASAMREHAARLSEHTEAINSLSRAASEISIAVSEQRVVMAWIATLAGTTTQASRPGTPGDVRSA